MLRSAMAKIPRFQQTMLRVKDPAVSVPFYEKHFGMKLIHKCDFPQWKFSVFFLELPRIGQKVPQTAGTMESETYCWSMDGCTLELTHNHGTEKDDPPFIAWSGNTGSDASGDLYRDEPKFRGFGHIAFNCDDVYRQCAELEAAGVKFQKKPDDGRMKGLAFALDPDGYWIEIVKRNAGIFEEPYNLSQTMMRVKDGPATLKFYTDLLGMTLIQRKDFDQWKFSLFFLASLSPEELKEIEGRLPEGELESMGGKLDPLKQHSALKVMWQPVLELTWNHGTESQADFKVHDGNAQPQGFGHIGFLVDDLERSCADMEAAGVQFKKKPADGNMRGIAFALDPSGYSIELIQRGVSFKGVAANL